MKKERYIKLRKQRKRIRLLALFTALSIFGCAANQKYNKRTSIDDICTENSFDNDNSSQRIINGVLYPDEQDGFIYTEYDAFARMSIPIYDSYKRDKEVIGTIDEYQSFDRTYTNGDYSFVTTENGKSGYVHNELIIELPDNYVEVDLSDQRVIVVNDNEIVLDCTVVTGKPNRETNIGYTEIWSKTYNRALTGPGYSRDVKYFFVFNDCEEGFHDASWRSQFGGNIYQTNGSLGCVNMRLEDVKIMDQYTEVGTKVLVHK